MAVLLIRQSPCLGMVLVTAALNINAVCLVAVTKPSVLGSHPSSSSNNYQAMHSTNPQLKIVEQMLLDGTNGCHCRWINFELPINAPPPLFGKKQTEAEELLEMIRNACARVAKHAEVSPGYILTRVAFHHTKMRPLSVALQNLDAMRLVYYSSSLADNYTVKGDKPYDAILRKNVYPNSPGLIPCHASLRDALITAAHVTDTDAAKFFRILGCLTTPEAYETKRFMFQPEDLLPFFVFYVKYPYPPKPATTVPISSLPVPPLPAPTYQPFSSSSSSFSSSSTILPSMPVLNYGKRRNRQQQKQNFNNF